MGAEDAVTRLFARAVKLEEAQPMVSITILDDMGIVLSEVDHS